MKRRVLIGLAGLSLLTVAGCSGSSSSGQPAAGSPGGTGSPPQPTATVTITQTATASASASPGPAENLFLSSAVREQLIAARAAQVGVKPSAFTGLAPGTAYYAIDHTTDTYWAGAGMLPSAKSLKAEVSSQDDGGYLIFEMKSGATWRVFSVGLSGVEGATCSVTVPPAVLSVWHWKPGTCLPPNS